MKIIRLKMFSCKPIPEHILHCSFKRISNRDSKAKLLRSLYFKSFQLLSKEAQTYFSETRCCDLGEITMQSLSQVLKIELPRKRPKVKG